MHVRAEVIGDPIAQSKSPVIHGFWIEKLGLVGRYDRALVTSDALPSFLAERRADASWRGCNVTMPHKAAVIPHLDRIDPLAVRVDAVNTIVREADGLLAGYNTDVAGVAGPLGQVAGSLDVHVQIIGAGGAARAAAVGAAQAGYREFQFFNRTPAKADGLGRLVDAPSARGLPLDTLGPAAADAGHVIINASSMGMNGSSPVPIDLADYGEDTIVFDLVYAPLETPLLAQARARGLRTIDGLDMLIEQAAHAFGHFFGAEAPRQHDAELRRLLVG